MNNYLMQRIMPLFLLLAPIIAYGQEEVLRIGLEAGPTNSWLSANDNHIEGAGSNLGMRFGLNGEKYFGTNYAFLGSFGLALDQGGTLKYNIGGNFLPDSDLSDPKLESGDKPFPDGTEINYHLDYLEAKVGLRLYTNPLGRFTIFADVPTISLAVNTGARGDIKATGIDLEKENIGPDVRNTMWSWGLGAGARTLLGDKFALFGGIHYQNSFSDVTRDKGWFATDKLGDGEDPEDPSDDIYEKQGEDSKARMGSLYLRLGLFF